MVYPYPGYCAAVLTEVTEVPGKGVVILQNFNRSSGYGYESVTELTEVPVLWHRRTELTDVPGRYKNAVPVPRVFVALAYRTYRSSGYGNECPTERT